MAPVPCDGLITPVGKAVRIGSVIAGIRLPVCEHPHRKHRAYCLHFYHDACRQSVDRCPVHALGRDGHDKKTCMHYTVKIMNSHIVRAYGLDTCACGLCQAGVACASSIPDAPQAEGE